MIDNKQLQHMQERQLIGLMDTCRKLEISKTRNDYKEVVETWTEVEVDIPCGLDQSASNEERRTTETIVSYDATIRLTIEDGETFSVEDKIRVTKRFGRLLDTPLDYQIIAPAQRGPSGIRFRLRRATL